MTEYEDLLRSLLVERFRPWQPSAVNGPTREEFPPELAREGHRVRRGRAEADKDVEP
jgi:hypothetical protein